MARSSKGCYFLRVGKPGGKGNPSTGHTFIHGAQFNRGCAHHADLGASDRVHQQSRHSREISQEQKEMIPQIGLKARLQHGSKIHPANRAKGRTGDGDKLQYMPGVHPGNTLPISVSKTHAGDRAGDRDIPNAAQALTGFPSLS